MIEKSERVERHEPARGALPVQQLPNEQCLKDFLQAQKEFRNPEKLRSAKITTKAGGQFSYSYADLADTLECVLPALHKHNLILVQMFSVSPMSDGSFVTVETSVRHIDGGEIQFGLVGGLVQGVDARVMGSAITYFRRYGIGALGIAAEDDDAEAATDRTKVVKKHEARVDKKPETVVKAVAEKVAGNREDERKLLKELKTELDGIDDPLDATTWRAKASDLHKAGALSVEGHDWLDQKWNEHMQKYED